MKTKTVGSSELTVGQLTELGHICKTNESGHHFSEFSNDLALLESLKYIKITRPVHESTDVEYDSQYHIVEITDLGLDVIEAYIEEIET